MAKLLIERDDKHSVGRMVYKPDNFIVVLAFAALMILFMSAAFIGYMVG